MLHPGVKTRARTPSVDNDRRHVATGAGQRGLDERGLGIVVMHAYGAVAHARDEQLLATLDVVVVELRAPLERRCRLGDKHRNRDGHRDGTAARLGHHGTAKLQHMIGQVSDGHDILVALTGKTHHEIELHAVPAGLEGRLGRAVKVLLGHVLVDDVAHALATGLGGKRQAALLFAGDRLGHIHAKRIQALRGNGYANARIFQAAVKATEYIADAGVISGRKRGKRHLVIAGLFQALDHRRDDLVGRALAHRAIRHTSLTKTTAAGAAAQDLDRQAIMNELRIGHARLRQRIGSAKVLDDALVDHRRHVLTLARHGIAVGRARLVVVHLIQRRHIGTGDGRESLDNLGAWDALVTQAAMQLADLEQRLLTLANQDGIEESRIRLGVINRRPAGDDDGIVLGAVDRQQRNAGEIERLEEVGDGHLVRHVYADNIERGHGRCALERQQRDTGLAHGIAHIRPWHITALAGDALGLVKDVV